MATQPLPAPNNKTRRSGKSSYRDYLSEEQVRRFMAVIKSPRDRAIFAVCYWRELRASELGLLPLSAYRPRAKTLFLNDEVPLSPVEVRMLNAWLKVRGSDPGPLFISRNGRGVCRNRIYMLMRKYGKLARLPSALCHPRSLKHSSSIHLKQRVIEVRQGFFAGRRSLAADPMSAAVRKRIRKLERELEELREDAAEEALALPLPVVPQDPIAETAARRQAVVMPILKRKRWTPGRLAIVAGVSKNSVYQYLDGTRARITGQNRQAIAEALDLHPENLPD